MYARIFQSRCTATRMTTYWLTITTRFLVALAGVGSQGSPREVTGESLYYLVGRAARASDSARADPLGWAEITQIAEEFATALGPPQTKLWAHDAGPGEHDAHTAIGFRAAAPPRGSSKEPATRASHPGRSGVGEVVLIDRRPDRTQRPWQRMCDASR